MTTNESWRRYLEMGATMGELTVARAEEIARGLVADDEEIRARAWRELDQLARFGMRMGEQLLDLAKDRLSAEVRTRSADTFDLLLDRLGDLLSNGGTEEAEAGRGDTIPVVAVETGPTAADSRVAEGTTEAHTPSSPASSAKEAGKDRDNGTKQRNQKSKGKDKGKDKKDKHATEAPRPEVPVSEANGRSDGAPRNATGKSKPKNKKKEKETAAGAEQQPIRVLALAKDPGSDVQP